MRLVVRLGKRPDLGFLTPVDYPECRRLRPIMGRPTKC